MNKMTPRWLLLLAALLWAPVPRSEAALTQAQLTLDTATTKPGDTVWAAVRFEIPFHWHIYWRNSGTTGIRTKVHWSSLPAGITAGPIEWPVPGRRITRIGDAEEISYDYDELTLLIPLQIGTNAQPGVQTLKAEVSWLECKTDGACVPGKSSLEASLTVGNQTTPSKETAEFAAWRKKLPPAGNEDVKALWDDPPNKEERHFVIEWKVTSEDAAKAISAPDFFAYENELADIHPAVQILPVTDGIIRLRKKATKAGDTWPTNLSGLLVTSSQSRPPQSALAVTIPITDSTSAAQIVSTPSSASSASTVAAVPPTASLLKMLLYAFLGGLILNIMPCVLPVIALKILGFVSQSKEEPKRVFHMGLVYGVGVLCSFAALAGLVIALKLAGQSVGWGFQFANAKFLVFLTTLVTLIALNLFGLFEVTLGGAAMNAASGAAGKEGFAGAFFQGVVATILATPCTAPILGTALGFAFAQPPVIVLAFFLTIGAGLAAPYVLLCWQPAWLKFLPKPGAWMEKFKIAMGFPMLATAMWLFWLTSRHYGRDGVLWFGIFLVVLALVAWVWGEFVQRSSKRRGLAMASALILLAAGYGYAMENALDWRTKRDPAALEGTQNSSGQLLPPLTADDKKVNWQPWSPAMIERARDAGRPVLVDFTAEWCATCQFNKKTSIEIASVRQKLKAINALPLTGDNTLEPPAIQMELKKFQRAGVPLVLVYPADKSKPPIVLPEALTPGIVLDALDRAAK